MADTTDTEQSTIVSKLEEFDIPHIAAKIYVHLTTNPPLSILEIAQQLGIARTTVYDNVEVLIRKKLAERIKLHKSQKIKAYPINALYSLIEDQRQKTEDLIKSFDELKRSLILPPSITALTEVRYYQGAQGLEQMIWNSLKASRGIVGYSTYGRREIVGERFYKRYIEEFKSRKLTDKVIINPSKTTQSYITRFVIKGNIHHQSHTPDVIRYLPQSVVNISGDTMIYNDTFAVSYWQTGEVVGFEIDNHEFVKTQRSIFKTLWKQAKPLTELL